LLKAEVIGTLDEADRPRVGGRAVSGWVSERFVRSGFDLRLWFRKINGRWTLVGLASGD
jgi:hypothetical protein